MKGEVPSAAPSNYPSFAFSGPDRPWKDAELVPETVFGLRDRLLPGSTLPLPTFTLSEDDQARDTGLSITGLVQLTPAAGATAVVLRWMGFNATDTRVWTADLDQAPCLVARAAREAMTDRAAYQFFAGEPGEDRWSADVNAAKPVFYANASGLSVSWNGYLEKHLEIHADGLGTTLVMHTARALYGPWEEATAVDLGPAPLNFVKDVREQPVLEAGCSRDLVISYTAPTALLPGTAIPVAGESFLARITLD